MEIKTEITEHIARIASGYTPTDVRDVVLTIPDPEHGDYATNIALRIAPRIGRNPRELAEEITQALHESGIDAAVAGPGFINITLADDQLWRTAHERHVDVYKDVNFVVEYSCPNYFKELHAGHLYQTIAGDVIARLIERSGATVHRVTFGGDVGLHVAKAMWGIVKHLGGEHSSGLQDVPQDALARASFISARYVEGSKAYDEDEEAKTEISAYNKRIYGLHATEARDEFAEIYFTCREWSKEYFVELYRQLDVHDFEVYYPESATEQRGLSEVRSRIGEVFYESDGAVIFRGEDHGLHTRVFITKENLPTYEAKDIGLICIEKEQLGFEKRLLITGRDQAEYMKVVWKAADQLMPGIEASMTHLVNGIITFGDGKKMSSRTGNVTTAMDVLRTVRDVLEPSDDPVRDEQIMLGAVKYEFLKHRLGGDIAFDPMSSVALTGNSGPYLQYAHVRARAILQKSEVTPETGALEHSERMMVRKLAEYQFVLQEATRDFAPHLLCTYLHELASMFNVFYENNRVVGDPRESIRKGIVECYSTTLEAGLELLGIETPEKM